jgi:hypothetical protein
MKTTSYLKTTILAMAIAGTSSAVFADLDTGFSINATVSNISQVNVANDLTLTVDPAEGGSFEGTSSTDVCFYSSTGGVTATFTGLNESQLKSATSTDSAIPYTLKLTHVATGAVFGGDSGFSVNTTGHNETLSDLSVTSDCHAGTVDEANNFNLEFVMGDLTNDKPKAASDYTDTVSITVASV